MNANVKLCFWLGVVLTLLPAAASAAKTECSEGESPIVSFVVLPNTPQSSLNIKAKLGLPAQEGSHQRCFPAGRAVPAVVILHGSSGIDSRGDFYARALNAAGIATLEIDMWEARGVTGPANRPPLPLVTYPDAFAGLAYLSSHPNVSPDRIGVLGFSWGGVVSVATAEQLYADTFGGPNGPRFKAHVAHYPTCYVFNKTDFPSPPLPPTPAQAGIQFLNLTGARVLIQIGSEDDYDNGAGPCVALANTVNPGNNNVVEVVEYQGAYHAWDRLMIPVMVQDLFGDEGSFFKTKVIPTVEIKPDVAQAHAARDRVVRFFRQHL